VAHFAAVSPQGLPISSEVGSESTGLLSFRQGCCSDRILFIPDEGSFIHDCAKQDRHWPPKILFIGFEYAACVHLLNVLPAYGK